MRKRAKEMKRMLDLFCGRLGWSKAFLARGWQVTGVDLIAPPKPWPAGFTFLERDVLLLTWQWVRVNFDFGCSSSPCEDFARFGLRCFHPNPPYPKLGIHLFNHTRGMWEASGIPYIMENVRSAEQFVGNAVARCGPFALWGNGVPAILPQGLRKGVSIGSGKAVRGMSAAQRKEYRKQFAALQMGSKSNERKAETAGWATIPPLLANAVADYAERLLEQTLTSKPELLGSGPIPSKHVSESES
jgi:hypothetical protein